MGWGVMDYPSGPRESEPTCSAHGCEMNHSDQSYECASKGCEHSWLCEGCTFTCADCLEEFCEYHTRDINEANDDFAVYLCIDCELAGQNKGNKPLKKGLFQMPRKQIVESLGPTSESAGKTRPGTKVVREQAKNALASRFKHFLRNATAEEVWFLDNVMTLWDSDYSGGSQIEVGIACAFEESIQRRGDYFQLPSDVDDKTKRAVEEFLAGRLKELPAVETTMPARVRKGCSEEEVSYCVRLIRVLRDNYWVAELVRQILSREAWSKHEWTLKGLRKLLDDFDTIETLARNAQRLGNQWSHHPVLQAIRERVGETELADYKSEGWVREAIESAHQPKPDKS